MHDTCNERRGVTRFAVGGVLIGAAVLIATVGTSHARLLRAIEDPVSQQGGEFGRALAAMGDETVVGAPGESAFGHDHAGLVQLFASDGVLQHTFEAPAPVTDAAFGTKVAVSDGLLYVSAPGDQPIGLAGVGAIYVFDAARGTLIRVVRAPASGANGVPVGGLPIRPGIPQSTASLPEALGFGGALAVVGDRIVVGAPDSIVEGLSGAGAVYLFDARGTLLRTLREFSPTANALFGASVAVIGDLLFVGEPGAPAGGVDGAGVVQAYDARTGDLLQTVSSPLPVQAAAFGAVVGEIGGALFVGAPGDQALGLDGVGAVYLFHADTAVLPTVIAAPAPAPGLAFGRAVIVVGDDLLVGADGAGPEQSGTAYLIDPATSVVRATFAPTTSRAGGRFAFALSVVGTAIAIGEPALDSRSGSGRVYLFEPTSGTATVGPGATRTPSVRPPRAPTTGATEAATLTVDCVQTPTTASVDCRLNAMLATITRVGLESLASPLRRARREVRRANVARGPRRVRALRRAVHGVDGFASQLEARGGGAVSADLRDALLGLAGAVEGDLVNLVGSVAP